MDLIVQTVLNSSYVLPDLVFAGAKPGTSPIFNLSSSTPAPPRKTGADDFLNSESDKNDYDW